MDAQQFAYWLQGFAELSGDTPPSPEQWKSIREHLALVFEKVTPPVAPGIVKEGDDHKTRPVMPMPNIHEILRWPPQTADRPWMPPYTVTCSAGSVKTSDAQTYC